MRRINQSGFTHVFLLLVLVGVLAIVGLAGYRVLNLNKTVSDATATTSAVQKKVDAVPTLKAADQTLSDVSNQLNSDLNTSALDSDIQTLY